jgi:hypothetical protein
MSELETTINSYFELSETTTIQLIKLVVFALLFGFLTQTRIQLERSTYLFGQASVYLGASILYLLWAEALVASRGQYQILLLVFDLLISASIAYSLIILAKARSNDAYGHSNWAFLAFIAIANLWLVIVGSKHSHNRDTSFGVTFVILAGWFFIWATFVQMGMRGYGITFE